MDNAQATKESRQRALTGQPNMTGLKPLTRCRAALRRAVEEADWLGEEERSEAYRIELAVVESKIAKGLIWEPEW